MMASVPPVQVEGQAAIVLKLSGVARPAVINKGQRRSAKTTGQERQLLGHCHAVTTTTATPRSRPNLPYAPLRV